MRIVCIAIFLLYPIGEKYIQCSKPLPILKAHEFLVEKYASDIYGSLNCKALSYAIFKKGLKGYFYLKKSGRPDNNGVLTIVDYGKSLKEKRLFVVDLVGKQILFNEFVGHAAKTGDEFAKSFSNEINSEKSSLGFYITGRTYWGKGFYSLRLFGVEAGFNSNVFARGIVLLGGEKKSTNLKEDNKQLNSKGCLVVSGTINSEIIETIKGGSCLFAYFPDKAYLESSIFRKFTSHMLN